MNKGRRKSRRESRDVTPKGTKESPKRRRKHSRRPSIKESAEALPYLPSKQSSSFHRGSTTAPKSVSLSGANKRPSAYKPRRRFGGPGHDIEKEVVLDSKITNISRQIAARPYFYYGTYAPSCIENDSDVA